MLYQSEKWLKIIKRVKQFPSRTECVEIPRNALKFIISPFFFSFDEKKDVIKEKFFPKVCPL